MNQAATHDDQKVLCYMKALYSYDPKEDSLHPCPEIGLMFFQGDILAIVNQVSFNFFLYNYNKPLVIEDKRYNEALHINLNNIMILLVDMFNHFVD